MKLIYRQLTVVRRLQLELEAMRLFELMQGAQPKDFVMRARAAYKVLATLESGTEYINTRVWK